MKKLIIAILVAVILAGSVSAFKLGSIRYDDPARSNEQNMVVVNLVNDGKHRQDVSVSVYVIGTDDYYRDTVHVPRNDKKAAHLYMDEMPPGEYLVRISAKDKDGHKTRYRYIYVE